MPRKKRSESTLAQLKMDRLRIHLSEVERLIMTWVSELDAPSPFRWSESSEAVKFETENAAMPVRMSLVTPSPGEGNLMREWPFQAGYVPPTEQDAMNNHILRKHLRKRAIWSLHRKWEDALDEVVKLAGAARSVVSGLVETPSGRWEVTKDFEGTILQEALRLAPGQQLEPAYSQKMGFSHGVWLGDILIEKSASTDEVQEVGNLHRQMVEQAAQSKEMVALSAKWSEIQKLKEQLQDLATKTLKTSDILYQCQFCRRLW